MYCDEQIGLYCKVSLNGSSYEKLKETCYGPFELLSYRTSKELKEITGQSIQKLSRPKQT